MNLEKWNSRKLVVLLSTVLYNILLYYHTDPDKAQEFSSAFVNALSLGYIIIQGWIDREEMKRVKTDQALKELLMEPLAPIPSEDEPPAG